MPSNQITLGFGGLQGIRGLTFSLTRGVLPSVFTLYVLPQDNLDPGVQTLTYGIDSNTINLTGCMLGPAFLRKHWDGKHPLWAVTGFDRRWKWQFSNVSGDYNRRKPDGSLDTATQKYPGELATLLGTALGESIDVSRMPTGVWPRAKWNNQRADLALQWLCNYVACEVVLNPLSNGIEIWPSGYGINTPTGLSEMHFKYRFVPRANIPSSIQAHGGDSLYQTKLQLKCVAANQDNSQKLLANWEGLSSSAIGTESPWSFQDISSTTNRINAYEGYMRTFRVTGQQDGSLPVPGCQTAVSAVDQYILNDYRLDFETDIEGYSRNLPYYLDGDYYAYTDLPNNASSMRFTGASTLYKDRRLVQTQFPVFKLDSSGKYQEPVFYLTTSYKVQDYGHNIVHVMRSGGVGGSGGTMIIRRPEVYATYKTTGNTEAQANNELDNYITLFQQKFSNPLASEITYAGFKNGTLDGNVCQATWVFHPAIGVETKVCEGEELDLQAISRAERARRMALDRLVEASQ